MGTAEFCHARDTVVWQSQSDQGSALPTCCLRRNKWQLISADVPSMVVAHAAAPFSRDGAMSGRRASPDAISSIDLL